MMRRRYPYEAAAPRVPSFHAPMPLGFPFHPAQRGPSDPGQVRNDGGTAPGGRAINWPGVLAKEARGEASRSRLVTDARDFPEIEERTNATSRPRQPTPRIKRAPISLSPPTPSEQHALDEGSLFSSPGQPIGFGALYIYPSTSNHPIRSDCIIRSAR